MLLDRLVELREAFDAKDKALCQKLFWELRSDLRELRNKQDDSFRRHAFGAIYDALSFTEYPYSAEGREVDWVTALEQAVNKARSSTTSEAVVKVVNILNEGGFDTWPQPRSV